MLALCADECDDDYHLEGAHMKYCPMQPSPPSLPHPIANAHDRVDAIACPLHFHRGWRERGEMHFSPETVLRTPMRAYSIL